MLVFLLSLVVVIQLGVFFLVRYVARRENPRTHGADPCANHRSDDRRLKPVYTRYDRTSIR